MKGKSNIEGINQAKSSLKELINCENSGPASVEIVKKKDLRDRVGSGIFNYDSSKSNNDSCQTNKKKGLMNASNAAIVDHGNILTWR